MTERDNIVNLYELYKELLTTREREYFEFSYYEDYSLQEISLNNKVSRAYVSKLINMIEKKLIGFEDSLKLNERNNKIRSIINSLDNDTKSKIEELL